MKLYIESDEFYPYYSIKETPSHFTREVEIDSQTYKKWKKVLAQVEDIQRELKELDHS